MNLFKGDYYQLDMKILEICPFSAGICGVWTRVFSESREFIKLGHKVTIFSSDLVKGSGERANKTEEIDKIKIMRFSSNQSFIKKRISQNVTYFDFEKELLNLIHNKEIDLVITHLLHPHSFKALKICIKYTIPCYLVTHAPFNIKRKFPLNLATDIYSKIKTKPWINKFTKVISISKWEYSFLKQLGVNKDKIIYIPNGIPEEFFKQKKFKITNKNHILFLGRIAPIKNIETLLFAAKSLPEFEFLIVGSPEEDYLKKINGVIKKNKLSNVKIYPPVYKLEKISLIDSCGLFVLPSIREAMPTVLLEAMARGKIVISSKTDGGKEIIQNNKNGFLFEIGDSKELARLIKENINGNAEIERNAINFSKNFSWDKLIKYYLTLFSE
jgi:glycosyltransferase involved in cell wall biosynthesis